MVDGGRFGLRPEDDDFTQIFNMAMCVMKNIYANLKYSCLEKESL
jgi:hypothetical protein